MLENDQTLAGMADALAKSADYRVLRRLIPRSITTLPVDQIVKSLALNQYHFSALVLGIVKSDPFQKRRG